MNLRAISSFLSTSVKKNTLYTIIVKRGKQYYSPDSILIASLKYISACVTCPSPQVRLSNSKTFFSPAHKFRASIKYINA